MKWNHWPLYVGAIIFLLILFLEVAEEFILPLLMPVKTRSDMFLGHIGIALVVCLVLVFFVLRPLARNMKDMEGREAPLASRKSRLRELTLHMTRIAEEERKTLARELHDRVGQDLSAINVNLNIIKNTLASIRNEDLEKRLLDTMDLVQEVTAGIRNVMYDLRLEVLEDHGLVPALRWYGEQFSKRTGLEVEVMGHEDIGRFDPELETTFFRIFQEAMTNVAKHADARKIRVGAERDGDIFRMSISDDGQGFEEEKIRKVDGPTYGLLGMRERARAIGARIQIKSSLGKGTRVTVETKV